MPGHGHPPNREHSLYSRVQSCTVRVVAVQSSNISQTGQLSSFADHPRVTDMSPYPGPDNTGSLSSQVEAR